MEGERGLRALVLIDPVWVQAITAAKLTGDYKNNEIRGDAAYKGQRMRITGKVGEVTASVRTGASAGLTLL